MGRRKLKKYFSLTTFNDFAHTLFQLVTHNFDNRAKQNLGK